MRFQISRPESGFLLAVGCTVFLALFPFMGVPRSWLLYALLFFVYLAMANMWNLLAGYSGLTSLCQPAFLGLAGYTLAIGTWVGVPWWIGLVAGIVVAAGFALLISVPVFRLSGVYFAIGTLVVPEALRMIFYLWKPVGGQMHGAGAGYMVKGIENVTTDHTYGLALVVGIGSVFLMRVMVRSKLGLGLTAIRDNARAAASCGIDVFKLKLCAFVVAAAVTGLAGGVYYLHQGYIEPSATFSVKWTMTLLLAAVIGGLRTEEGPILGTAVVVILYFLLARYGGYSLLIQGILLVGLMMVSPQGIAGLIRRK